jgi:hypothetical protein
MAQKNPSRLMGYLTYCSYAEDLFDFRDLMRQRLLELQKTE